jgi:hypothetical protein
MISPIVFRTPSFCKRPSTHEQHPGPSVHAALLFDALSSRRGVGHDAATSEAIKELLKHQQQQQHGQLGGPKY